MNRRAVAAAAAAVAVIPALAACQPQAATGAAASTSQGAAAADPTCTVHYPGGTGITVQHGKVAGTLSLVCNGAADITMASLTLAYAPTGTPRADDQEAAGQEWQGTQAAYAVTAACKPGSYALHVLYSGTVAGSLVTNDRWGGSATVTAAQCGGA